MSFYNQELQEAVKTLRFVQYLRRSSKDNEDKQMRSIEGQMQDLDLLIKQYGIKLVREPFVEKRSAFEIGRPLFSEMMEMIRNGRANAVLVWHSNRIARNYADGGLFVQLMSEGKLRMVLTPHGIFQNNARDKEYLMTGFTRATRDSDDKSEAVKRGNRTKLKIGHVPSGRLAEGYIHSKNDRGEMVNIVDPARFPLLQKAVQLVINQTHTPMESLNVLNNEWGYKIKDTRRCPAKPLSKSCWYKILSDRKYCGEIERSEGVFAAGFPKMIEPEEFDKIQVLLGRTNRRRTPKEWTFAGDLVCDECGAAIVNDEKWQVICSNCRTKFHKGMDTECCLNCHTPIAQMVKPKLLYYHWLHCGKTKKTTDGHKCQQKSVRIAKFEKQVDALLEKIEIPKDFTDWAIAVLNEQSEHEIDDRQLVQANLRKGLQEVEMKLDNLLMLKISPHNQNGEVITEAEYLKQRHDLLAEKEVYERQLKSQSQRQNDWLELSEKTFNFACYARYWFNHGTKEQKRNILKALGLNLRMKDQKILIDPHKPFQIIADMKENFGKYLLLFEPAKFSDNSIKNDGLATAIPSLLRDMDSNHDKQIQSLLSCR